MHGEGVEGCVRTAVDGIASETVSNCENLFVTSLHGIVLIYGLLSIDADGIAQEIFGIWGVFMPWSTWKERTANSGVSRRSLHDTDRRSTVGREINV